MKFYIECSEKYGLYIVNSNGLIVEDHIDSIGRFINIMSTIIAEGDGLYKGGSLADFEDILEPEDEGMYDVAEQLVYGNL